MSPCAIDQFGGPNTNVGLVQGREKRKVTSLTQSKPSEWQTNTRSD